MNSRLSSPVAGVSLANLGIARDGVDEGSEAFSISS
jgi:hypothetical protein